MSHKNDRREFLKKSGVLAGATILVATSSRHVHAAGDDKIKIAIVGCGGRGSGAVRQALAADPNVVLWAIADTFPDKAKACAEGVRNDMEKAGTPEKFNVADERVFVGFDAYKKAIDSLSPGDVVLLCTPPGFRPLHFEYAVEKGVNIFAEKPLAVDIPGLKRLKEANKKAVEKGLKVGVGLNNRHYDRTTETVKAIQDGGIGDVVSLLVYRMHPPHRLGDVSGRSPLEVQLRHIFNFNWTTGGFIVDALIHNLDIACSTINQLPVAAQGQGGRVVRKDKDQLLDHSAVDYRFADGRRLNMYTQTIDNTWHSFEAIVHGTKGSAALGEGVAEPKFFKDYNATRMNKQNVIWTAQSPSNNSYQTEHDRLFKAIRDNQKWNEMETGINATFIPILGRMAVETGQMVTAEDAWNSTVELVPNVEKLAFDDPSTFPLVPDANGDYPFGIPGTTKC
ncbi:MAG: Gfo/Idh/MocA family protein [Thermoguttaceae bacterium]